MCILIFMHYFMFIIGTILDNYYLFIYKIIIHII